MSNPVRTRAVLSAGSNIGDRRAQLARAVQRFAPQLVAVSRVYATAPWGGVEQEDFYNITLIVEGEYTAADWLAAAQELEQEAERVREVRWGPRTLDVDVISVAALAGSGPELPEEEIVSGEVVSRDPLLTLPHPRAAERAFVLIPWLEIDPAATLWTSGGRRQIVELVAGLSAEDRMGVRPVGRVR